MPILDRRMPKTDLRSAFIRGLSRMTHPYVGSVADALLPGGEGDPLGLGVLPVGPVGMAAEMGEEGSKLAGKAIGRIVRIGRRITDQPIERIAPSKWTWDLFTPEEKALQNKISDAADWARESLAFQHSLALAKKKNAARAVERAVGEAKAASERTLQQQDKYRDALKEFNDQYNRFIEKWGSLEGRSKR